MSILAADVSISVILADVAVEKSRRGKKVCPGFFEKFLRIYATQQKVSAPIQALEPLCLQQTRFFFLFMRYYYLWKSLWAITC